MMKRFKIETDELLLSLCQNMSKYKPKEIFWEDDTGKLQKGTVGGVDKSEVLLMETYSWEKTSSFINPDILKAKLENAKRLSMI